jgi:F-type H+-transporting ATPase subunit beta
MDPHRKEITMTILTDLPAGDALLGRVIDTTGAPIDGRGPIAAATRLPIDQPAGASSAALPEQLLETGIKVLDLYAPIVRGGVVPMIAGSGVGKVVVSNELIRRVATRRNPGAGRAGGCVVMAFLDHPTYGMAELVADMRGAAVDRYAALLVGQPDDPQATRDRLGLAALALAESFCEQGRETLLFLEENLISLATVERFVARRRGGDQAALTTLLWQHDPPILPAGEQAYARLLGERDGQIAFSRALAKQSIWPAIDPLRSTSRLLDGRSLGAEHTRVAGAARQLLRDHGDIEGSGAASADPALQARARRVLLFGSQPFFVAEPFTAVPGVYVPLVQTLRGYSELVDGRHDAAPEEVFRFVGEIGEALRKVGG